MTETGTGRPSLAWRPLLAILAAVAALLASTVTGYGYHRDELYFRVLAQHPAWGYFDEPPLTPMIAKLGIAVFGDNLWGLRVFAALFALATIVLVALLTRELGGGTAAQVLAAVGAVSPFVLISGHVLLTSTPDMVVWLLVILFAARALLRDEPRWWLAVGVTVGLGLYNKQLIALLLIGLAGGLLIAGPRRAFAGRWLWTGAAVALVLGLPNVLYQMTHHWPELTMAGTINTNKGGDDRAFFVPFQLILVGPPLVAVQVAGFVRLLRDPAWRPVRALAWAYPIVCVIVLGTGGQPYYTLGLLLLLLAAGSVVTARWMAGRSGRRVLMAAALAVNMAVAVVVSLPVFPVRSLPAAIAAVNQTARDSIGWPAYVREIAAVYDALPAVDRARAVIVAQNYGEAGAVARFGPALGLPAVYSGLNQLYAYGPPPDSATVAVMVGYEHMGETGRFASCVVAGTLDDQVHVDNEEQGLPITVCRDPSRPWHEMWPDFRHSG